MAVGLTAIFNFHFSGVLNAPDRTTNYPSSFAIFTISREFPTMALITLARLGIYCTMNIEHNFYLCRAC